MDDRSTAEILRAARTRIVDPKQWTTAFFARTASGEATAPRSTFACRWCAVGALLAEANHYEALRCLTRATGATGTSKPLLREATGAVGTFNDSADHSEVLDLYDRAIELAEAA